METLGWDEIIDFLQRAQIHGLLWEGFLNKDLNPRRFHHMASPVYLESDIGMLKISTATSDSYLSFSVVDAPVWESFEGPEDMDGAGLIDLSYEYFGDWTKVQCQELRIAHFTELAVDPGQAAMAGIEVSGGALVTFDPWNFSGLRVHGGVPLESVLAQSEYLVARTTIRTWTR